MADHTIRSKQGDQSARQAELNALQEAAVRQSVEHNFAVQVEKDRLKKHKSLASTDPETYKRQLEQAIVGNRDAVVTLTLKAAAAKKPEGNSRG